MSENFYLNLLNKCPNLEEMKEQRLFYVFKKKYGELGLKLMEKLVNLSEIEFNKVISQLFE